MGTIVIVNSDSNVLGLSAKDREDMLAEIGISNTDRLFDCIPPKFKIKGEMDLPPALMEWELNAHFRKNAERNSHAGQVDCYLGGGSYDHHVPAVIDAITSRGEFLTAYTPYQPEMSQGLLGALNDFTLKVSSLTGLPVVTSSHYDGATALAEATWMAVQKKKKSKVLVSAHLLPQYRAVLETYSWGRSVELITIDAPNGADYDDVAAVVLQSPNHVGVVEDHLAYAALAKHLDCYLIGVLNPWVAAISKPLSEIGFDIVVLEGQSIGLYMSAGGAHLGILACTDELRHLTPGRLIGQVSDIHGKPALALVFEDREQHVARERATSNICSNQALNAIRSGMFLSLYGGVGMRKIAALCHQKARALALALDQVDEVRVNSSAVFFNEFSVYLASGEVLQAVTSAMKEAGIFAGLTSKNHADLADNQLLIAVTETKSKLQLIYFIEKFCEVLGVSSLAALEKLDEVLNSKSNSLGLLEGHLGGAREWFDENLQSSSEVALVRKFTNYTRQNFGVDTGPYPLGSCTMKYNPKRNDALAELDGFRGLHPLQPLESMEGLTKIYSALQDTIATLTGMDHIDLTPAAGAHGELKGLMIARAYFEEQGQSDRREVIIPDSAHGTNPASATMVGYECRIIDTRPDGMMDVDALKRALSSKTAVVMMTNPSTFGLFEEEIEDIVRETHAIGGLLYYDGANMNALMGYTNPGLMGFDIAHINVHKTLSTPHGGGGPGAGPIGVKSFLKTYLSQGFTESGFDHGPLQTKLYFGHISVLLRAYAYIRTLGAQGLKQATSDAVLNANYLMHCLREVAPPCFDRFCMHEALLDGSHLPITTLDLSKRMIDYDIHPPTLVGAGCVYYGEQLSKAMLFEPTESESKAELDFIVDVISKIVSEVSTDLENVLTAPHRTSVARLIL